MNAAPKPETAPDEFVDNEPSDEIVNDSLGAVDQADTTDTGSGANNHHSRMPAVK
jgi:hypothetical protein